jgi:hypothetical protein
LRRAYQVLTLHKWGPDLHGLNPYHDDDCPWLLALQNEALMSMS